MRAKITFGTLTLNWSITLNFSGLTCTQSYGHVKTVIPKQRRLHKTCKKVQKKHRRFRRRAAVRVCGPAHTLTRHSHSPGLRENISVDVHHQVASSRVLHHKANVLLRLETRKQVDQERVTDAVDRFKDPLLAHQTGKERRKLSHHITPKWPDSGGFVKELWVPVDLIASHNVSFL